MGSSREAKSKKGSARRRDAAALAGGAVAVDGFSSDEAQRELARPAWQLYRAPAAALALLCLLALAFSSSSRGAPPPQPQLQNDAHLRGSPQLATPRPDSVFYFAYASDLSAARVRAGSSATASVADTAVARDLAFEYSLFSKVWRGGVADLVPRAGAEAWGVVYEFPRADLPALDKQKGVGGDDPKYRKVELTADSRDGRRRFAAFTYVVNESKRMQDAAGVRRFGPSMQYRRCVLKGAREAGLPKAYVAQLAGIADNGESFKRKSVGTACD